MTCSVGMIGQFSSYAICSPNLWMIVACTCMTLLTMLMTLYMNCGFRRNVRWLKFTEWKLQQLAERLRIQEPNVGLLMQVTRKVNDKKNSDKKEFDFFNNRDQNNNIAGALNEVASKTSNGSMGSTDVVAAQIRKARDEDVEKVLRESNMDILTPDVQPTQPSTGGSQKILKKWTGATIDLFSKDEDENEGKGKKERKNKIDRTQED
ncbi:uncharacterized protein CELE_C35D10.3 [Caenorhabditis elegans]|uniref:Uncharacterized protein n=1 Tax=Caenorhabditis elegans TaxID=6239 RepID=Q18487_CAEEL|nr:Uncharacterized protein CELE_C35D10.3 [Caenorhabditis elegans]CCD66792.1 Uncharacterized protein CELE_C35D10.3 [Caenorhabditis elegans]|eukprot:NP_498016.2 Uncharacterized protein CELE_C35D10.3 [Caenorhabditis elegans]